MSRAIAIMGESGSGILPAGRSGRRMKERNHGNLETDKRL